MSVSAESAAPTVRLPTCTFDPTGLCPTSDWRDLSDGGYSEVYKAKLLGMTVAVKAATSRKKTSCESMMREIRYLRQAGPHPNIVQPFGAFYEGDKLHLVLEFARHCLRSDRVARQCDPIIVMAGVARALVHIHGLGIIHRDLKVHEPVGEDEAVPPLPRVPHITTSMPTGSCSRVCRSPVMCSSHTTTVRS